MLFSSGAGGRRYTIRAPEYLNDIAVSSRHACFSSGVHVAAMPSIFFTVASPSVCTRVTHRTVGKGTVAFHTAMLLSLSWRRLIQVRFGLFVTL